jgi:hypothetical protein
VLGSLPQAPEDVIVAEFIHCELSHLLFSPNM